MSVSNAINPYVDGSTQIEFLHEGGTTLYHFSPYASKLSTGMDFNVILFANDRDHAKDIIKRGLEHVIECEQQYRKNTQRMEVFHLYGVKKATKYLEGIDQWVIGEVTTRTIMKVAWASNDTAI